MKTPLAPFPPVSVADVARILQLHPRSVKRIWKRIRVAPDVITAKGKLHWSRRQFRRFLRAWKRAGEESAARIQADAPARMAKASAARWA